MTFVPANAAGFRTTIAENARLSRRYFLLRVDRPENMPDPAPGQFIQLRVPESGRFFLRRPFSVFGCTKDTLDLLIVEAGEGTKAIRRMRTGDPVEFYGPLGTGFPSLTDKKILGIGGGVGLAPLYFYAFGNGGQQPASFRLVYGGRTREDLFLDHFPMESGGVLMATDDGSFGFQGSAVDLAAQSLAKEPADAIFSCGPTPMLRAAERLAAEKEIPHFVSLENRMACGLGACRGCVVPTKLGGDSPYRTVCHDGPVFDAADLVWDKLPTP